MAAADQNRHDSAVRPRSYQDESYQHGFLGAVGDLQKAEVLQDVVLEVEGRRFPCHRLVLSAASPYFRAMFTSDMAESRQKTVVLQMIAFHLQGLDAGVFWEILSYIYSGTLHVSLDKVQHLYQAADLLQLDYVRDTCSSYIVMNVHRSTCVDLYKFADLFSMDIVRNQCLQCIYRHFSKVASTEEFCSLSVNQLTEIISHDELDVKEEITVWEAVVRWVQHSKKDRLRHLPSILPHIRFNLLTPYNMVAILDHPLVKRNPGRSAIRNVVKETSNMKKRVGMDTLEMAMIFHSRNNDILFMNPRERKYISRSFPGSRRFYSKTLTVTSDNDIYILGNEDADCNQLSVLQYNHAENAWERASMSSVRWHDELRGISCRSLVEVNGIICLLCVESTGSSRLAVMKKYNWHTDQWQECSQQELMISRPRARGEGFCAAMSCGLHLYVLMNIEMCCYDPTQDHWCKRTPPKVIPKLCTAVSLGTEIFCTDKKFTKTMVYDTESDCWQVLPGWPNPGDLTTIGDPSLFVLENQLHVLLEPYRISTQQKEHYLVFVYDRSADAWRDLEAAVPYKEHMSCGSFSPVARMYLPCLNG
ncbi:kelch-like protein 12 [Branchiostoma lanceolatum]|uniref:kelch-like protein 12 n=1 Tax=Branchiostoma lanceolatum TaxID=7740 RepID=UPI0034552DF7